MNFNKVYKTTYPSDRYGGNHTIGLTIEFIDLDKIVDSDTDDNVIWDWELLLDGKTKVSYFMYTGGGVADPGCYYIDKDEHGHEVLGDPFQDYEIVDEIREYIKKEWPIEKREEYIRIQEVKGSLSSDALKTFEELIDEL